MKKVKFRYTNDSAVARIILDDGKGNVIDHEMMEDLMELFNTLSNNNGLKIIIFEGEGNHFSFGASVEEHQKEFAATMIRSFHQLFYRLMDLSVPMLAKVSGQCLGGGLELALMCNFIFADKTARMCQPEISLGVFPPPASILLPEKIGLARAEELLITGRSITAEWAKEIGLVNELFEDKPALETGIEDWISKYILPKSASSLRLGVKATRIKFNHVLSNFLPQLESLYVKQLMATHDANEGIASFLEKRQPVWNNS
jgi:cyclohexa-1,5-dienecarbonyl-CoA hydratase